MVKRTISVFIQLMSSTEHGSQHTVLVLAQSGSPCHEAMSSNVNRYNSWNLLPIISLKSNEHFWWSTFIYSWFIFSKSRINFSFCKFNRIPAPVLLFKPFGENVQEITTTCQLFGKVSKFSWTPHAMTLVLRLLCINEMWTTQWILLLKNWTKIQNKFLKIWFHNLPY